MKEKLACVVQIKTKSRAKRGMLFGNPPLLVNQQPRETLGMGLAGC